MQNNQKRNELLPYSIIVLACIALIAFGAAACQPKPGETALPFETIAQEEWGKANKPYEPREPGMVIISRAGEIINLDGMVSDESVRQLQTLDYGQYFAITVFQGRKGSTGYDIQVNRIGRSENIVNVYAQLDNPPPDIEAGAMETSPYHLVKVQKTGSWGQEITFNLFAGETLVASLVHTIP